MVLFTVVYYVDSCTGCPTMCGESNTTATYNCL